MEDKKTLTVKRERQTIELLKLIAYEDLSKFIDKYDYLGVMLTYRSYATTILEANGMFNKQHIVTDEERFKEVEEYRRQIYGDK